MPADADNLRAELGREPLRLATLAVRTWGLAGPNERDVTDRLRKRIGRELRLRFGRLEGMAPDELRRRGSGAPSSRRSCAPDGCEERLGAKLPDLGRLVGVVQTALGVE